MTIEEFKKIIDKPESSILDFKKEEYDFSRNATESKQSEFVKDIISFANTIRAESAYIVIGIKSLDNGQKELCGIERITDDAILQQKIKSNTIPHPMFSYSSLEFEGKTFGIIEIPVLKYDMPIISLIKMKGIEPGKIYFRRGTSNSEANGIEIINISDWLRNLPRNKSNNEKSIHHDISKIISKLTAKQSALSLVISECLSIAKTNGFKKLEKFCFDELTGYKKSKTRNFQFRSSKVLVTPLSIEIPNYSDFIANRILKEISEIDGVFESRLFFKQPIIEIEDAIEKLQKNQYSLMTMQTNGETFFEDKSKKHLTLTYYIGEENFVNVHNNIRQKLFDLLLEL